MYGFSADLLSRLEILFRAWVLNLDPRTTSGSVDGLNVGIGEQSTCK